ncbi:MAG: ATP phosphoribosyltransferase regulatory subunit [Microcoleaceae cyanobacterium]
MVYQPALGARDLLPLDVDQKIWIERRLQQVFHRWGYHRIITSTLERLDTLTAGGAVQPSTVVQLQQSDEAKLGLRPEFTASIARAAVTRMIDTQDWPQRLYYNGNIFRKEHTAAYGAQLEFYQAGVELLGAAGLRADGEILLLLLECLENLGLTDCHLILGEAGLTRSLLSSFPAEYREQVRRAIAHLDRIGLEQIPLSDDLKELALFLFDLRGKPEDVLAKVSQLELDDGQKSIVTHLKSLIDLLRQYWSTHPETALKQNTDLAIILDLSLIQTFDYYTGIVFTAVSNSDSDSRVLAKGGRYDQLLGLYHPQEQTEPGIGFAVNIEDLHHVLLNTNLLPKQTPASDWLVVPETEEASAAAFSYAQTLRESNHLVRVEIELNTTDSKLVKDLARRRRINQIAWVNTAGNPRIETI